MDRSYPYSRRLASRSRLHKRIAAVTGAGIVGASALFMLTSTPDPYPAQEAPVATPWLARAAKADVPRAAAVRRIYPYSIIPGGAADATELARAVRTDRVVAEHYATFDVAKARPVTVDQPRAVHVSYRKDGKVYWTAKKVMLAPGETLLTDGKNEMRARCANRISDLPQYPVEAHHPAMDELDNPIEVAAGEQYAMGADVMPLSSADTDGIAVHTGMPGRVFGGAAAAARPGDAVLARASGPEAGLMTLGQSGLSNGLSSRPRFASTPASSNGGGTTNTNGGNTSGNTGSGATDPGSSGSSGGTGGSSGVPTPSTTGTTPAPAPATPGGPSLPVAAPVPDTGSSRPPVTPAVPTPQPPLAEGQAPVAPTAPPGLPTIPGTPLPGTPGSDIPSPPQPGILPLLPLPQPTPLPGGIDLPPILQPGPVTVPERGETPPRTPLPDTPPKSPPGTDPLNPPSVLAPPPQNTDIGAGAAPAEVPEPNSLWLVAIALAALSALRRRGA